jgi:hypothetical protein
MTATNHALTGTALGLIIASPEIAIPLAFLSHFVCDAIPHYGSTDRDDILKTSTFRKYLYVEAFICFLIVLTLFITRPHHWLVASICAFLATSPDLYWIKRYKVALKNKPWRPGLFGKFASNVQWFQAKRFYNPVIGVMVEIVWGVCAILLILPILTLAKS